ncbi:MAG: F0F1 ATP synthase subunit B [Candidatus Levybacteria bacterium]|nr:F0F1 ATP synthase subunit B [Candidatus Levybacteria bacterium]
MDILKDFGVNPLLLIGQIINFLIILFLLKRYMYRPILDIIKKREEAVKEGIKNAEEGQKKLEEAVVKEKEILSNARAQAEKMLISAREESEELKGQIEETTRKDTEKMVEQAKERVREEARQAEERLIRRIGEIAISLLEKSMIGVFGKKEQKIILKKAITELGKQDLL